jgi:molecular chaperone DnaK (HSP70)
MKDTIKNKKINLHSIELVGGGSRIPAFISTLKDIFNIEPSRTLNSS